MTLFPDHIEMFPFEFDDEQLEDSVHHQAPKLPFDVNDYLNFELNEDLILSNGDFANDYSTSDSNHSSSSSYSPYDVEENDIQGDKWSKLDAYITFKNELFGNEDYEDDYKDISRSDDFIQDDDDYDDNLLDQSDQPFTNEYDEEFVEFNDYPICSKVSGDKRLPLPLNCEHLHDERNGAYYVDYSKSTLELIKDLFKEFPIELCSKMSNEVDEDEAFLYGSEDEGETQSVKKQKLDTSKDSEEAGKDSKEAETNNNDDEEDEGDNDDGDDDGDEDDDDDDSSDSDIEFIIGSEEPKQATTTTEDSKDDSTTTTAPAKSGVSVPEAIDEITDPSQTDAPVQEQSTTEATITRVPGIELNKVGEYDGKPITSINLQDLKEKPWRQPGADISEYFNFGFDEFTWTAYCSKQDKLRSDFNPQKIMMSMMPMGLPPMMMGMPGFPPPGAQMPQMPGVPQGVPSQGGQPPSLQNMQGPPPPPSSATASLPSQQMDINNTNGQGIPPPPPSSTGTDEKSLPLNPNLPRAPRERDSRDRMEREGSWGGNDGYRDRERRPRGGRR